MRLKLLLPIYAVVLTYSASAMADQPKLKGQYAFTGTNNCIVSGTPFNANLTPTSFTISVSFSVVGVLTFNGNGTASMQERSVSTIVPPVTDTSVSPPTTPLGVVNGGSADGTAILTYSVDKHGLLSMDLMAGTFLQVTAVGGPNVGSSWTVDHQQLSGMVSADGKSIVLAGTEPLIETQVINNQFTRYRVCHRTRVLTWIGEAPGKDGH